MDRNCNFDKLYEFLRDGVLRPKCSTEMLNAAFPLAKPDPLAKPKPDYGMSGPRWSNNPTPPGDGIDEMVYLAYCEPTGVDDGRREHLTIDERERIATAVRKDRELRGEDQQ